MFAPSRPPTATRSGYAYRRTHAWDVSSAAQTAVSCPTHHARGPAVVYRTCEPGFVQREIQPMTVCLPPCASKPRSNNALAERGLGCGAPPSPQPQASIRCARG